MTESNMVDIIRSLGASYWYVSKEGYPNTNKEISSRYWELVRGLR